MVLKENIDRLVHREIQETEQVKQGIKKAARDHEMTSNMKKV